MENERKRLILFWFSFYSLFGAWKIVNKQLNTNENTQKKLLDVIAFQIVLCFW